MKRFILLILLFFAAVAISPLLINEKGYILIAMGDLTIESTVVTATIMLILSFVAMLMLLKFFRGGVNFSFAAWNKIAFASRRRALRDFNKGIAAYVLGDYKQAEHLLAKSAEPSSLEHVAYLVAADAAQKQKLRPNTEHYLALLEKNNAALKTSGLEAILIKIKLLLAQQDVAKAREIIDLHHKHIGHDARLLTLEIELSLTEQRFDYVIGQLPAARKQKAIAVEQIHNWESLAFYGAFSAKITQHDNQALAAYWQQLPRKIKQNDTVIASYCRVLAEHNIVEPLTKLLLPIIKKGTDERLIKCVRQLPMIHVEPLLLAAQKNLQSDPHSALWLSAVAHFAVFEQQWPLAEKAFHTLMNLPNEQYDTVDLFTYATVLEQQSQVAKANQILRKIHL
jgi:HemY protein